MSENGLSGANLVSTILEFNHKLTIMKYDKHIRDFSDPALKMLLLTKD